MKRDSNSRNSGCTNRIPHSARNPVMMPGSTYRQPTETGPSRARCASCRWEAEIAQLGGTVQMPDAVSTVERALVHGQQLRLAMAVRGGFSDDRKLDGEPTTGAGNAIGIRTRCVWHDQRLTPVGRVRIMLDSMWPHASTTMGAISSLRPAVECCSGGA